jgi:GNAT superfamily N-acetyltransferase
MRGYAEALWGLWNRTTTAETFDVTGHFLIERDGAVVGCVAETWHPDHLFIDKLYVDAPFQRQGIGAAVLRMRTREAAVRGLPTKLSVLTTNPADAFYRREGFEVESETTERRLMSKAVEVGDSFR